MGWKDDFCLFLFSSCRVANARLSFGYACALRLAGQKNKFAKIHLFIPWEVLQMNHNDRISKLTVPNAELTL